MAETVGDSSRLEARVGVMVARVRTTRKSRWRKLELGMGGCLTGGEMLDDGSMVWWRV